MKCDKCDELLTNAVLDITEPDGAIMRYWLCDKCVRRVEKWILDDKVRIVTR